MSTEQKFYLQDEAYSNGKLANNMCYIAKDTRGGGKIVTSFKTLDDFLLWSDKQKEKNFYEKIIHERCEYYDIDIKPSDEYYKNDTKTIIDNLLRLRSNWISTTNYKNVKQDEVYVLESKHQHIKKSYHIVIRNGYVFKNNMDQKIFIGEFSEYIQEFGEGLVIDTVPYGQNQCFRCIDSSKIGTDRTLIRSSYNLLSLECDRKLFFPSNIEPELDQNVLDTCIKKQGVFYTIEDYELYKECILIFVNMPEIIKVKRFEESNKISNSEALVMFEKLNKKRFDDFKGTRNLIWLCKELDITDDDVHKLCEQSDKYNERWVQNLIDHRRDECGFNIGTLYHFLKEDVDEETYNQLKQKTKTLSEILSIPEGERTNEEKEYLLYILPIIKKKNLDKLTKTSLIKSIKKSDEYVQSSTLLNSKKKVIIVKAGLGRGKSYATGQYIKQSKYDNIIVLTPRRSYARSATERLIKDTGLNFVCYLNKKKLLEDPFIVIQAESLFRLQIMNGNNLIIIDEVEAFLYQLTSVKTHKENHVKNIETFIQLIKNSNKVIVLDAFISDRTLQTFSQLSGNNHLDFYEYTQKLQERKATEVDKLENFINSLISDLEKGKKIFLFSSSNTKLCKTVKKTYKKNKPDKVIMALLPAIREKFKDKNIIEFHSKHVTLQLTDVNTDWKDADLIACTSSITVGVNFDTPDVFHKVYIYANASSKNIVRDIFQASWRVRHLIDNEMVYCLDEGHYGQNLTTNMKQIEDDIENKNDLVLKLCIDTFSKTNSLMFPSVTPDFIKTLLYHNKLEENMSVMNLRDLFERYLELCNYKKDEMDLDSIIEVEFDEFISDKIQYHDIPSISSDQAKALIRKKLTNPLLEMEALQVEKWIFQCLVFREKQEVEEGLWKIYSNFGKGKFRNISIEKGIINGTCTIQDIIEKDSYTHLNSGMCLRLQLIREITSWVGMNNTSEYGYKLTKEKLDSIISKFEENRKKIHIAFDMRDGTKGELDRNSTLALINKILDRWSYSAVKSEGTRKRVGNKLITVGDYILEGKKNDGIDIEKHIKPYNKKEKDIMHPLLKCKEDKKIINDEELEKIRLDKY